MARKGHKYWEEAKAPSPLGLAPLRVLAVATGTAGWVAMTLHSAPFSPTAGACSWDFMAWLIDARKVEFYEKAVASLARC